MTTESEAPLAWPFRIPVLRVFLLQFVQTRKRDRLLLILLACIMSTAGFLMQGNGSYDSDGWFLLASGREIVEHGIPYANPWSFSSYRPIVVQQWLHDVLLYGSYTLAGYAGTILYQAILAVLVALSIAFAIRGFDDKRFAMPRLLFCIGLALFGAGIYISVRPTAWSMACMCLTVGVCTRWRRTGDWRYLIALPAITVLHVNMQSAMWLLDVFLAGCFLLPDDLSEFKTATPEEMLSDIFPLSIALIAMLVASFVNPYGADGARYVITSMGAASYGNVISEMKPAFEATKGFCIVFFAVGFIPVATAAAIGRRRIGLPLLVIVLATFIATMLHWRNVWTFSIACALAFASMLPKTEDPSPLKSPETTKSIALIALLAVIGPLAANCYVYATNGGHSCWVSSECSADSLVKEIDEGGFYDPVVYAEDPVIYSYLEWKGIKVPFDLRPELWDEKGVMGVTSPYRDYVDGMQSKKAKLSYLTSSHFDYYIVSKDSVHWYKENLNLKVVGATDTLVLLENAG
ncbi:hypothetical protein [Collinsella sp. CLA-AA-H302]|uniref:hypothetical protein n=1 Tax=Collinsella sp. CLA-AA-H302 TaxID=3136217 RepID=UPI0032C0CD5E